MILSGDFCVMLVFKILTYARMLRFFTLRKP